MKFEDYIKMLSNDELVEYAMKTIREVSQCNEELLLVGKELMNRDDYDRDSQDM